MPAVRDPGVCCVRPEDISGRSRRLESGSVNGASHSNARITEDFEMSENIHEECGVFGVYAKEQSDVAGIAYYGLYALQHRGQESCGMVVNDDGVFVSRKDLGLVNEVFSERCTAEFSAW